MVEIGFHCSHEQHSPADLLRYVKLAQEAGFEAAMCSDHFHPWSERQGQSGFAWSWLGSALEGTNLSFGTVCAPGQRYHPAIIAQAAATLEQMYPGRFWLAVGSGEALNEIITGEQWPNKAARDVRLRESVNVIRALWSGETVSHEGRVKVREARLYSLPESPPLLLGAALTTETAAWMGTVFDGLITAGVSNAALRDIVSAFRENGGTKKPIYLQAALCYARTKSDALQICHRQWRHAALKYPAFCDLSTPREFDEACAHVKPEELKTRIRISDSVAELWESIMRDAELGFERIYLHHVGRDVEHFIDVCRERLVKS